MFIREQMINSLYDLHPRFYDDELLDIYINSPRTCRWQNWTFKPGFYKSPELTDMQRNVINRIKFNVVMFDRLPKSTHTIWMTGAMSQDLCEYLSFCRGDIKEMSLNWRLQEFIHSIPTWGTSGT